MAVVFQTPIANKANQSWVPEKKQLPAPDMMDRFDYIMKCLNDGKFVKEFEELSVWHIRFVVKSNQLDEQHEWMWKKANNKTKDGFSLGKPPKIDFPTLKYWSEVSHIYLKSLFIEILYIY